jgi:hypothetical protein
MKEKPMKQRRSIRLWNQILLSALVLLATGSALCTVAASAAAQAPGSISTPTAAP